MYPARDGAVTTACVPRFVVRTMCAVLGLVARQEDSGLRDHRVRVLISNHVTPFDHNIVNLLTSCSTVSGGQERVRHGRSPGTQLKSTLCLPRFPLETTRYLALPLTPLLYPICQFYHFPTFFSSSFLSSLFPASTQ